MDATQSTENTPTQQDEFGHFVTNRDHLDHFDETRTCVCGYEDDASAITVGRFFPYRFCERCHREYLGEDEIVHPHDVLTTSHDGLVHASADWGAYYLLTEQVAYIQDYIEFDPRGEKEAWLWAHDGLFIGYLLYNYDMLRAMVIAEGFRGEGHGSAFLEAWYERFDHSGDVDVMCTTGVMPFYEQTAVPFTQV